MIVRLASVIICNPATTGWMHGLGCGMGRRSVDHIAWIAGDETRVPGTGLITIRSGVTPSRWDGRGLDEWFPRVSPGAIFICSLREWGGWRGRAWCDSSLHAGLRNSGPSAPLKGMAYANRSLI